MRFEAYIRCSGFGNEEGQLFLNFLKRGMIMIMSLGNPSLKYNFKCSFEQIFSVKFLKKLKIF